MEEFRKNIKLTIRYICENAIFLNISLDVYMKHMLCRSFRLLGNLIRNRPSLHFNIMRYKGESSSNKQTYVIENRINYIKYFESFSSYTKMNPLQSRRVFLNRIEYDKMKLMSNSNNQVLVDNVKHFRRRRGILRKNQLDLMYKWDHNIVKQNYILDPPHPSLIITKILLFLLKLKINNNNYKNTP